MLRQIVFMSVLCLTSLPGLSEVAVADEPVTYSTHIRKIFRDHCNNCHNVSRQRAGLDLSSYAAAMKGSSSGEVLIAGQPDESFLYLVMAHEEEPAMPPGKSRVKQSVLDQMKFWIEIGLPEKPEDVDPNAIARAKSKSTKAMSNPKTAPAMPKAPSVKKSAQQPVYSGRNGNPITAMSVSPDGELAAVAGQLQVLLFDLVKSEFTGTLPVPEGEIFQLQFSADGKQLVAGAGTAAESGQVLVWSVKSRQRVQVVGDEYDVVFGTDISPDSRLVLFGGPERILKIADLQKGKIIGEIKKHTDWVTAASFSPEGLIFTSADRDGNAYVWETENQTQLHTLRGHSGSITAIQWSSDGNLCITSAEDGTIRVWDMHTGDTKNQWLAHKEGTLSLHAKNDTLVTAGRDGFVRRWSLDGTQLAELKTAAIPTQVAAIPGGTLIGDWSGQISVWREGADLQALSVPEDKQTNDLAPLLAEVSGPAPITELELVIAKTEDSAKPAINATLSPTLEEIPVTSDLTGRLARARTTLQTINQQLTGTAIPQQADHSRLLLQMLADADRIAGNIKTPSSEIAEARVFLKAALEKARIATASDSPGQSVANATTAALPSVRQQLTDVQAEIAAMAKRCRAIETEYTEMDTTIGQMTEKSTRMKTEFVRVTEQLGKLSELSIELEKRLKTATD